MKLSKDLPCYSSNESIWYVLFPDEHEKYPIYKTPDKDGWIQQADRYVQIDGDGISLKTLCIDDDIDINDEIKQN